MLTANGLDLQAAASSMRFKDQSAVSTTGNSSPGLPAPSSGVGSSPPGDALGVGLLLIFLFGAALLIPFERLIPQEHDGSKSSPSINTDSPEKKNSGGTERGQYDVM